MTDEAQDMLIQRQSEKLQTEFQFPKPARPEIFHMVLLVSVFQAEAQLDLSGLGLNSAQSVSNSFLVIQAATAGEGEAGSSFRHFADFSLN